MKDKATIEAIKELKKEAGLSMTGQFVFSENEIVKEAVFSCHKIDGKYCFGLFLPKNVPIYGKGKHKDEVVGQTQKRVPVVLTSDGKLIEPSIATEKDYKIKYIAIPSELEQRLSLEMVEKIIKGKSSKVDGAKIYNLIKETYEEFLFFNNKSWYDVHSLWDMGTYFFELFNTYPLFELQGLSGSAKSKTMNVSRLFSLNASPLMVNPSESALFRTTHEKRWTKYIDEAEKLFQFVNGQYVSSPIIEVINGSYAKGSSVPRVEKVANDFITRSYGTYSPTMVGSIAGLKGATETRAITHIMTKAPDSDKRGELEVEEIANKKKYSQIRDYLYLFAFQNFEKIEKEYASLEAGSLRKRDFQLWRPLLAISKVIDSFDGGKRYESVKTFAEKTSKLKRADFISEGSLDYQILSKFGFEMTNMMKNTGGRGGKVHIKYITKAINEGRTERIVEKTISNHLDKMGFKEYRGKDMEGSYLELSQEEFNIIVSPICPSLSSDSSDSSDSSFSPINNKDNMMNNKNNMMNDDEQPLIMVEKVKND